LRLWGGCFDKSTDNFAFAFQSSIRFDQRLYKHDILGSISHVKTLQKCGFLTQNESISLEKGLFSILEDIQKGTLAIDESSEDIHSFIEFELTKRLGAIAKKIHTGRSRNDQITLDLRMYLLDEVNELLKLFASLQKTLLGISEDHIETIMPGFTHLQRAQPVTFGHHMMAYFQMFKRDIERLLDSKKRISMMPLGSGALSGTTFPLDREFTKDLLGFFALTANSMDAVSDRDYIIETLSNCSMIMMHLSRFCEELILWSTQEFSFIQMDDAFSTGSSIMPQKKNPDMVELIRGKTGRVYGDLMNLLTLMKSLPLCYNKDMQEDKEPLFDALDTVKSCLMVFQSMLSTMRINKEKMSLCAEDGYTNATDLADYLVKKGLAFREAHKISGEIVKFAMEKKVPLTKLTLEDYQTFTPLVDEDLFNAIALNTCVSHRKLPGGPAKSSILDAIKKGETFIQSLTQEE
jgi:argininosuccinate lyase